jgi:hypothetical protein
MQPDSRPRCFFCGRPGATATAILGGPLPGRSGAGDSGGTRIACCPTGEGCKDGRIYHGPPTFAVHWPDAFCGICGRSGGQNPATGRRIAGNSLHRGSQRGNGSQRHR